VSTSNASGDRTYVLFRLGAEEYALDIAMVQSIVHYERPVPVPKSIDSVLGVLNLRGKVIPIIDLGVRLGRETFAPSPGSRIIVVEGEMGVLGLAVDAANEVTLIDSESVHSAPDGVVCSDNVEIFEGVVNRGGKLVIIVNLGKALPRAEFSHLGEVVESEGGRDV